MLVTRLLSLFLNTPFKSEVKPLYTWHISLLNDNFDIPNFLHIRIVELSDLVPVDTKIVDFDLQSSLVSSFSSSLPRKNRLYVEFLKIYRELAYMALGNCQQLQYKKPMKAERPYATPWSA